MIGYLCGIQELYERFRRRASTLLEIVRYPPANIFGEVCVKINRIYIYIRFKVEFDREIGWILGDKHVKCELKKGGFAGLARGEDNKIFSLFDSINKVGEFSGPADNVVLLWGHGAFGSKGFHCFSSSVGVIWH
jgi:hypothetical protein